MRTGFSYSVISKECVGSSEWQMVWLWLSLSITSSFGLIIVLGRIIARRVKQGYEANPLGGILDYLIAVQVSFSLCFHIIDIIDQLDCSAPPLVFLIKDVQEDSSRLFSLHTIGYYLVKEGIGAFSLWWHATIAYSVYACLVLKLSVGRLHRPSRLPFLIFWAIIFTVIRFILFVDIRKGFLGFYLGIASYGFVITPIALICTLRWYILAVIAVQGPSLPEIPAGEDDHIGAALEEGGRLSNISLPIPLAPSSSDVSEFLHQQQPLSQVPPSSLPSFRLCSSFPTVFNRVRTSFFRSSSNNTRNRLLIRRLMRISVTVCILWLFTISLDMAFWLVYFVQKRSPSHAVGILYGTVLRLVGLCDAIILSEDCMTCCGQKSKPVQSRLARPVMDKLTTFSSMVKDRSRLSKRVSGSSSSSSSSTGAEKALALSSFAHHSTASSSNRSQTPLESIRVFASTYNMGGVERDFVIETGVLAQVIPKWVPKGYDLYAIGVQECQCLAQFRKALHEYLGGEAEYMLYGNEIGDTTILHGKIAVTIVARTVDVVSGAFQIQEGTVSSVAAGVTLGPIGRAANKGMTGLSARYYDVNLAFITAHFASDKKNQNRLAKRNEHACTTLRELSLMWDSGAMDVHLQHTHAILLGDLNYRVSASNPEDILVRVANSARLSRAQMLAEAALPSPSPPLLPSATAPQQEVEASLPSSDEDNPSPPSELPSTSIVSHVNWRTLAYQKLYLPDRGGRGHLTSDLNSHHPHHRHGNDTKTEEESKRRQSPIPPLTLPSLKPPSASPSSYIALSSSSDGLSSAGGGGGRVNGRASWELSSGSSIINAGGVEGGGGRASSELSSVSGGSHVNNGEPVKTPPRMHGGRKSSSYMGKSQSYVAIEVIDEDSVCNHELTSSNLASMDRAVLTLEDSVIPSRDKEEGGGGISTEQSSSSNFSFSSSSSSTPLAVPCSPEGGEVILIGEEDEELLDSTNAWGWVPRLDELSRSMQQCLVFWGFEEGRIHFPPSYRWHHRRAYYTGQEERKEEDYLPDDYTDIDRLAAAYTTTVVDGGSLKKPRFLPRLSFSNTQTSSASSGSTIAIAPAATITTTTDSASARPGGDQQQQQQAPSLSSPLPPSASRRVPSYTDRILTHSLPGKSSNLSWKAYELADQVDLSDHRPIAASLEILVDKSVRGFTILSPPAAATLASNPSSIRRPHSWSKRFSIKELLPPVPYDPAKDMAVFTFTISHPTIQLHDEDAGEAVEMMMGGRGVSSSRLTDQHLSSSESKPPPDPNGVSILFPLIAEDPYARERLTSSFIEAIPAFASKRAADEPSSSYQWRNIRWTDYPSRFQMVASRRFSEHLLLKVTDNSGTDLGQTVIPVALGLGEEDQEGTKGGKRGGRRSSLPQQRNTVHIVKGEEGETKQRQQQQSLDDLKMLRFPLASGGCFKGWLTLHLQVRIRTLTG